jgi:hypothetical protein
MPFTAVRSLWSSDGGDVDPYHRRITGPAVVAHAVARRLTTPRGSLSWAPGEGFDLRELVNDSLSLASSGPLEALIGIVRAEVLRDERVETVQIRASFTEASGVLTLAISGETGEGPFDLVLAVSQLTTEVLRIT